MDLITRQAHPGPDVPAYRSFEEKLESARQYQMQEGIQWPVLVDDLKGTVHQTYGELADPTYLIDANGLVAYYNMWTHAPTLHRAIEALIAQEERGVVRGGVGRWPHLLAAITNGWHGLRRGLPQSYTDMELALPGSATMVWAGDKLRPVLAPVAMRDKPLPATAKFALGAVAVATVLILRRART